MSKLEKLTCVCLITVCILSGYAIIARNFFAPVLPGQRSVQALVGKELNLPGVTWRDSSQHVVVALTSECRFCRASLPFYRQMAAAVKSTNGTIELTVVSPESVETTAQFLGDNGVAADHVVSRNLGDLGVIGTPTMFLVNSRGIIVRGFSGKLSPANESAVMKAIAGDVGARSKG